MIGLILTAALLFLVSLTGNLFDVISDSDTPALLLAPLLPVLVSTLAIFGGLSLPILRQQGIFRWLGLAVAWLTASCSLGAVGFIALNAWLLFTNRFNDNSRNPIVLPAPLLKFFETYSPLNFFGPGFWIVLAPFALVALVALTVVLRGRVTDRIDLSRRLSGLILGSVAAVAAPLFGGTLAGEGQFDMINPGDLWAPGLAVVALGALAARVFAARNEPSPPIATNGNDRPTDLSAAIVGASRYSTFVILILYLAISQINSYSDHLKELIEARNAFASDVVNENILHPQQYGPAITWKNGKISSYSTMVSNVPWGTVDIITTPYTGPANLNAAPDIIVDVKMTVTHEHWSAVGHAWKIPSVNQLRAIADRDGISAGPPDDAVAIYPKVERWVDQQEIIVPGVGLSVGVASFALLVPFAVFAVTVLMGERLTTVLQRYRRSRARWIVMDAKQGFPLLLAWLWLAALAVGPWTFCIVLIKCIALLLRAKGALETYTVDFFATGYVLIVIVLVLVPTMTVVRDLVTLRSLAQNEPKLPTKDRNSGGANVRSKHR